MKLVSSLIAVAAILFSASAARGHGDHRSAADPSPDGTTDCRAFLRAPWLGTGEFHCTWGGETCAANEGNVLVSGLSCSNGLKADGDCEDGIAKWRTNGSNQWTLCDHGPTSAPMEQLSEAGYWFGAPAMPPVPGLTYIYGPGEYAFGTKPNGKVKLLYLSLHDTYGADVPCGAGAGAGVDLEWQDGTTATLTLKRDALVTDGNRCQAAGVSVGLDVRQRNLHGDVLMTPEPWTVDEDGRIEAGSEPIGWLDVNHNRVDQNADLIESASGMAAERDRLMVLNAELVDALKALRLNGCFCPPEVSARLGPGRHAGFCVIANAAIAKAEGAK